MWISNECKQKYVKEARISQDTLHPVYRRDWQEKQGPCHPCGISRVFQNTIINHTFQIQQCLGINHFFAFPLKLSSCLQACDGQLEQWTPTNHTLRCNCSTQCCSRVTPQAKALGSPGPKVRCPTIASNALFWAVVKTQHFVDFCYLP